MFVNPENPSIREPKDLADIQKSTKFDAQITDSQAKAVKDEERNKEEEPGNHISKFFSDHTHVSKAKDALIDLRIGNPLKRITELLEDIKRQKAFNFTLKGSLGIMGVFLTLSIFGIFGGGQILCDKGTQVEIGTIRQLQVLEEDSSSKIPVLSQILDYFTIKQKRFKYILIKSDDKVIQLPYSIRVDLAKFTNPINPQLNQKVIATGNYDSCSGTLTIKDPASIEFFNK